MLLCSLIALKCLLTGTLIELTLSLSTQGLSGPSTTATATFTSPKFQGQHVSWQLGSPFATYPFIFHDADSRFSPGYDLLSLEGTSSVLQIRANGCMGTTSNRSMACDACQKAVRLVETVEDRARRPPTNLGRMQLSFRQLAEKLEDVEHQLQSETLKVRK